MLRSMTSAKQACEELLQAALDDGGTDNITIVVEERYREVTELRAPSESVFVSQAGVTRVKVYGVV